MPSAEVIAIANHKGGVTKTVTSVSLAVGLARAGWRTLLVDCDAQANATSVFDPDDDVEYDLADLVKGVQPLDKVIRTTRIEGLDLLPSTLALAELEQDLITMHRREDVIRYGLEPVADVYDTIILDLPPNLGTIVIAGLSAANSVIIPTDASRWGCEAVSKMLQWSETLREARVLTADLLGVLLTKYESHTNVARAVLKELQESPVPLFKTLIPKRVAAEKMAENRVVLGDPNSDLDLTKTYGAFAIEVMDRVLEAQANRGKHRA